MTRCIFLILFGLSFAFSEAEEGASQISPTDISTEEVDSQASPTDIYSEKINEYRDEYSDSYEPDVEKIKVTGSRVKRIDFEGPSPVTIFTKEELDRSGYFSLSGFIQNTSISNFGGTSVHNRSTITLVNGKRLVYDTATSYVPNIAIKQTEILKDGASALYGGDAAGGVINIITNKDPSKNSVSIKLAPTFPINEGGNKLESGLVWSKDFSKGLFTTAFQFQYGQALKHNQRKDWYSSYFLPYSYYPSFATSTELIIDPNCPTDLKTSRGCNFDFREVSSISDDFYELSNYNYLEYEISSDLTFYSHIITFAQRSMEEDSAVLGNLDLPADHGMSKGTGNAGTLKHLYRGHYGDEISEIYFLDFSAGLKGYVYNTWDYDFNLKWSNLWSKSIYKDSIVKETLIESIKQGKYDPFNSEVSDLSGLSLYDAVYSNNDARYWSSLDFSGEGLWGTGLAFGFQAYYNDYKNTPDARVQKDEIYALAPAESGFQSRLVISTYVEAVKVFADMLEIQAAGRIDRYSDFGLAPTGKLAFRFQPIESFLLRGSVGNSYDAPSLASINAPLSEGYLSIYDTVACYNELQAKGEFGTILEGLEDKTEEEKTKLAKEFLIEQSQIIDDESLSEDIKERFKDLANKLGSFDYCKSRGLRGMSGGNKDLGPTKAITASAGFVWQIGKNHSLTFDYWYNLLHDRPLTSFSKKAVDAELRHGKDFVEEQGVQYERDGSLDYNPIINPVSQTINLAQSTLHGFDLKWTSEFPNFKFQDGHFYFKNTFSPVVGGEIETFPGMGFINNLGKFGLPKWRNFATLGWKSEKHNVSLKLKTIAGTKKARNQFEKLSPTHILDLFYTFYLNQKTTFNTGFYNVLFLDPVIDDSLIQGTRFDSDFYPLIGPYYFVEWKQSF